MFDFPSFALPILATSQHLLEHTYKQVKFPKSRKRRIRKKWSKNKANWGEVHVPRMYSFGSRLVCDPITYQKILAGLSAK